MSGTTDADLLSQGAAGRKPRSRKSLILSIAVIIVIAGTVGAFNGYFLGRGSNQSIHVTSYQTWSQWGMSIQYPAGLNPILAGALQTQATSSSGEVSWAWNNTRAELVLLWINTSRYDTNAGFQGIQNRLQSNATNVQMTGSGNVTLSGHSWQYRTWSYIVSGQTGYVTYSISYYSGPQRAYVLGTVDDKPDTLSLLQLYGSTFSG